MQRTRVLSKETCLTASGGKYCRGTRTIWVSLFLGMAVTLCIPNIAKSDAVSGRVYGLDGKPKDNTTFTATPVAGGEAVEFKSDASGNFSVYLEPGRYKVRPSGDSN